MTRTEARLTRRAPYRAFAIMGRDLHDHIAFTGPPKPVRVDEFDSGTEPVSEAEVAELHVFLRMWWPALLEDFRLLTKWEARTDALYRVCVDDMRRIQAGRAARHLLPDPPARRQ